MPQLRTIIRCGSWTGALCAFLLMLAPGPSGAVVEGFSVTPALSGLSWPTAVAFAPDGRVFVTERYGLVKMFDGLDDDVATVVADLSADVHTYGDRSLHGLAVDPAFPSRPYVYVLYQRDAPPGGQAPYYLDYCPPSPSGAQDGCPATARLLRLQLNESGAMTSSKELLGGSFWCHQYPSHAADHLAFGPDGALYASAGDGAHHAYADYGQHTGATDAVAAANACGDPPAAAGMPLQLPTSQGGALRSQDLRTAGDAVGGSGSIIRIDPDTGAAMPDNPLTVTPDSRDDRHVAYGLRNPFRFAFRPGTTELWVADVGWTSWEELNRVADPRDEVVENFGWPCYEGSQRQGSYDALDLTMCEQLYETPGAVTQPFWAFTRGEQPDPDTCTSQNAALSGVAFADKTSYPVGYEGALFVSDYSQQCIWSMKVDAFGVPDPALAETVASGVIAVDLDQGPDGRMYFPDMASGTISRLDHSSSPPPPSLTVVADPPFGATPLTTQLTASVSHRAAAPEDVIEWDLDGDGTYGDAFGLSVGHTFNESANVAVAARLVGADGTTAVGRTTVQPGNEPPTATILAPAPADTWSAGGQVAARALAEDGGSPLPPEAARWSVILQHCSAPSDCHEHPQEERVGTDIIFHAPEHEAPAYIDLRLSVTDERGLVARDEVRISPRTTKVSVVSDPPGAPLMVGRQLGPSPISTVAISGSRVAVSAPELHDDGTDLFLFRGWSDGRARNHQVTVADAEITLTARYERMGAAALVVGDATVMTRGDRMIQNRLRRLGYMAQVVSDEAVTAVDMSKQDLVMVSTSVVDVQQTLSLAGSRTPLIVAKPGLYDDFGMTPDPGGWLRGGQHVTITRPTHSLAANLFGTRRTTSTPRPHRWGRPGRSAVVAATLPTDDAKATVFGYLAGARMPGRTAPARRVGLFVGHDVAPQLTPAGWRLFDAAVLWADG